MLIGEQASNAIHPHFPIHEGESYGDHIERWGNWLFANTKLGITLSTEAARLALRGDFQNSLFRRALRRTRQLGAHALAGTSYSDGPQKTGPGIVSRRPSHSSQDGSADNALLVAEGDPSSPEDNEHPTVAPDTDGVDEKVDGLATTQESAALLSTMGALDHVDTPPQGEREDFLPDGDGQDVARAATATNTLLKPKMQPVEPQVAAKQADRMPQTAATPQLVRHDPGVEPAHAVHIAPGTVAERPRTGLADRAATSKVEIFKEIVSSPEGKLLHYLCFPIENIQLQDCRPLAKLILTMARQSLERVRGVAPPQKNEWLQALSVIADQLQLDIGAEPAGSGKKPIKQSAERLFLILRSGLSANARALLDYFRCPGSVTPYIFDNAFMQFAVEKASGLGVGRLSPESFVPQSGVPGRTDVIRRESWQERALCRETDPEAFFPEKGESTREAKRICAKCLVRQRCLEYSLANDEHFGVWGGLSERERRKLKKHKQKRTT